MKIAIYPGSFDPITNGHLDVLARAAQMFDKVIILVAINADKKGRFPIEERVAMIKESISEFDNVEVDSYDGLTVEYAKAHNSKFLIRGLRAVTDFDYEFQLAAANEYADPSIDTVFLMSKAEKSFINSSAIIELAKKGIDVSGLVPPAVVKRLK
ncbi:MAG: pantetheine-phosphate adenylyltransferase [Bacilli bacterium]|nr:pantetheine-phosphate adenylyltransferase [Bacilli bacterium]